MLFLPSPFSQLNVMKNLFQNVCLMPRRRLARSCGAEYPGNDTCEDGSGSAYETNSVSRTTETSQGVDKREAKFQRHPTSRNHALLLWSSAGIRCRPGGFGLRITWVGAIRLAPLWPSIDRINGYRSLLDVEQGEGGNSSGVWCDTRKGRGSGSR